MSTELLMPTDPLYLQSWVRIFVETDSPSFDDLVYRVEPVHTGCTVSLSRDGTFDPDHPHFILVAGGMTGEHKVYAIDKNTGDHVGEGLFSVSDTWAGIDGPPVCFTGKTGDGESDDTFGGGDPGKPQNYEVHPQEGELSVAVVILETSDLDPLSATDANTLRQRLAGELFDGVPGTTNGECADAYFREVSHGRFWLSNFGIVGPIRLPNAFMSYAPEVKNAAEGTYKGLGEFARAAVAEIRRLNSERPPNDPLLELEGVGSLFFVIRSIPPSVPPAVESPGASHWPTATRPGGGKRLSFQIDTKPFIAHFPWGDYEISWPIERTIECVAMPAEWASLASSDSTSFQAVATHELGHNLGLPDEYPKSTHSGDAKKRDVDKWSLMSDEEDYPHLSAVEKLLLGWTRKEWVKLYNFAVYGPVDDEITLTAAELGEPDDDTYAAIELRRGDGSNYYFEYRRTQVDQISDQTLPEDGVVLATDFLTGTKEPKDRRFLLLIRDDDDADKGTFADGDDYEEKDTTTPEYPNDLLIEVTSAGHRQATVKIRYGDEKPDPQITNFSEASGWRTSDIVVSNARSDTDAKFKDVPWEGHPNFVSAHVRNPGKIDARGVKVDFFWKNYALTDAPEIYIDSATRDVPKGMAPSAFVEFKTTKPWVPPIAHLFGSGAYPAHYCVVARIAPYATAGPPVIKEVTPVNNEAQSNYTHVNGFFASPASRNGTGVTVVNDEETPTRVHTVVGQTNPLTRTYLEHAWVTLEPGEQRDIAVMTEWIVGDNTLSAVVAAHSQAMEKPNTLRLTGVAGESCALDALGGVSLTCTIGQATEFREFVVLADGNGARGRVVQLPSGVGAEGKVLLTVRPAGRPELEQTADARVHNGNFRLGIEHQLPGPLEVQAFFFGDGVADCDSWIETV